MYVCMYNESGCRRSSVQSYYHNVSIAGSRKTIILGQRRQLYLTAMQPQHVDVVSNDYPTCTVHAAALYALDTLPGA